MHSRWNRFFLAPEGDPAGGAATVSGGGGSDPAPQELKLPDGLPDHVKGKTYEETVGKLWGAYKGWRDEVATRGAVPKSAEEYRIGWPDDVKAKLGDLDKDPTVKAFLAAAHKHGATDKFIAAFLPEFLAEEVKAGRGAAANRIDPEAEAKKLLGDAAKGLSPTELAKKSDERLKPALEWVDGLMRGGVLDEETSLILQAHAETAAGVRLIEAIRGLEKREHGPQGSGQGGGGAITRDELRARNADPRNDPSSPKFDRTFAAETEKLYQQHFARKVS